MDKQFIILLNANLSDLVRDAWYIMRLRYRPTPIQYLYGLPVLLAVMFAIGLVNAVSMIPLLGNSGGACAFGILVGISKVLILTRTTTHFLPHHQTGERLPYLGYVLAGESLILPSLLVYAIPETAMLYVLWSMWAFWAQAMGFVVQSGQPPRRVVMAYVAYWLMSVVVFSVFFVLFTQAGWLDAQTVLENAQRFLNAPAVQ